MKWQPCQQHPHPIDGWEQKYWSHFSSRKRCWYFSSPTASNVTLGWLIWVLHIHLSCTGCTSENSNGNCKCLAIPEYDCNGQMYFIFVLFKNYYVIIAKIYLLPHLVYFLINHPIGEKVIHMHGMYNVHFTHLVQDSPCMQRQLTPWSWILNQVLTKGMRQCCIWPNSTACQPEALTVMWPFESFNSPLPINILTLNTWSSSTLSLAPLSSFPFCVPQTAVITLTIEVTSHWFFTLLLSIKYHIPATILCPTSLFPPIRL